MKTLVIATTNRGKLHEILQILGPDICLKSLADFPNAPEVIEDGDTFEANAIKKASIIAEHTGLPTLADDSGLEVDALNGAPGIYSARFSGENATDSSNNTKLLCLLENTPDDQRTARFRCAIAIVSADGTVQTTEAAWEGRILRSPRGEHGFGYDPLFLIPDQNCTSAELPPEQKNRLSHRGQALRAAKPLLLNVLEQIPE